MPLPKLDALEHAVARALLDGKEPGAYLRHHRSARLLGRVIEELHAKGVVRYEKNEGITTPIVTAARLVELTLGPERSSTFTVEQVQRAMNYSACNHYVGYRGAAAAVLTIPLSHGSRVFTWRGEVRLLTPNVPRHPRIRGRLPQSDT